MIKFSIIIPCYNSEYFIDKCLNKLNDISFNKREYEVIFIDDFSTDNTYQKLENYSSQIDFKVKLLRNKVNSGPGLSRRMAAEAASGEFLCFCDSDDWFLSSVLSDLDQEIKKSKSDLVFFDMSYILGVKVIRKNYTAPFEYGNKLSYLSNCAESLCNLAVSRTLFLLIPSVDIRIGEDLALVPLLIANANKVSHIDKSYYNYVLRNDSISLGKIKKDGYIYMLQAFEHIRINLESDNEDIKKCIEYLGIKTVLYNSTISAIKGENNNRLLDKIVTDFTSKYPDWNDNIYIANFGLVKNVYIWFLKHKIWKICRLYVSLHSYILTQGKNVFF